LFLGVAPVALLSFVLILAGADSVHATFDPSIRACVEDFSTVDPNPTLPGDATECDGSNAAGASTDLAFGVDIAIGDVNFGGLVTYIPNEWEFARGEEFPVGTRVGLLEAIATIGIINGSCDNTLNLITATGGFTLFNGSLDINDTFDFDVETEGDSTVEDWAEDLDGDGLKDFVTKYPEFVNRVITDEDDNPQQPIRRSAGHLVIAGAQVLVQFLIYEPGTFINKNLANDPALGYPAVVTLQNIGDPEIVPEPGPITDFCTPLGSTTTNFGIGDACDSVVDDDEDGVINDGCPALDTPESESEPIDGGDPCANVTDDDRNNDLDFSRAEGRGEEARVNDGCPQEGDESEADIKYKLYTNPQEEGTYTITTIAVAQPDADTDGLENSLDTCPFDPNQGDPRIKGDGDFDEDGLDAACDPDDEVAAFDWDDDGYPNRQDNCPLEPNGENASNQKDDDVDADSDRQNDGVGDDCDPEPLVFNGEPVADRLRTLTAEVEVGPPTEDGQTPVVDETPDAGGDDDDDGGGSGVIIIIIAVVAGVVVLGGGAFYFMRRGGGGSAPSV
jgi:hypothetical protein